MKIKRIVTFLLLAFMLFSGLNGIVVLGEVNPFEANDRAFEYAVAKGLEEYVPSDIPVERELLSNPEKVMLVKIKASVSMQTLSNVLKDVGFEFIGRSTDRVIKIPVTRFAAFKSVNKNIIEMSMKDTVRKLNATPNDLVYNAQWALKKMNFSKAWDITKGSESVKVGIIDTGIMRTHGDLVGTYILNGWDVTKDKPVVDDRVGHGTAVASIIGASTNNLVCMSGGAWNVTILPIKVSGTSSITTSNIIKAIAYAIESKCKIVNMSLGGGFRNPFDQYYLNKLNQTGCIIVASSGNSGNTGYMYPASNSNVISVGACDYKGKITYYSQVNNRVDLTAPGDNVLVAANTAYGYRLVRGTSFAAPYAVAAIALMCSIYPTLTHDELQAALPLICDDAGPKGKDNSYGYGIMNAEKAVKKAFQLQSLLASPTPTTTPAPTSQPYN